MADLQLRHGNERPGKRQTWCRVVVAAAVAAMLSSCESMGSSRAVPVTADSEAAGSVGASPTGQAQLRVVVTFRSGQAGGSTRVVPGVAPGPYASVKSEFLSRWTGRAQLVRDYDRLPQVLLEVRDRSQLDAIADDPAVASIQVEGQKETF